MSTTGSSTVPDLVAIPWDANLVLVGLSIRAFFHEVSELKEAWEILLKSIK